ncbi:hypothetical protein LguiA_013676 [Lonicera macranthoides]
MDNDVIPKTFRALIETADRKFARARDIPVYGRESNHYFPKVFKSYMRVWKYQQDHRSNLLQTGLQRWEIGEIASRIGQLYFSQYMRTSEARFLLKSYIFYEAILNRGYFEGKDRDRGLRFKELRFCARFLLVSLILSRWEMVRFLAERFKALVDDSTATFRETNFKEWKLVGQEIARFLKVDTAFINTKPLRYCAAFESYPASLPYVARFHAKKVLKFGDALLTSYNRNEVKYAELTLDTFRMLQCLEYEPSGSFYQKHQVGPCEDGALVDHSVTSGLIDINLVADMMDPTLPANPRKAILYRPSVTQLIAVVATISEELPPDSIMLMYLSASGKFGHSGDTPISSSGSSRKSSKLNIVSHTSHEQNYFTSNNHVNGNGNSSHHLDNCLWLGPSRNGGSNNLYPADIIPFTRRPLFLIIDSDNSHAFKAGWSFSFGLDCIELLNVKTTKIGSLSPSDRDYSWNLLDHKAPFDKKMKNGSKNNEKLKNKWSDVVLHGAERGEPAALLLSPLRPTMKNETDTDLTQNGSQFTLFLASPLHAFCQLVGLATSNNDEDVYNDADSIISSAFSEWEVILCTSTSLDLVWAQVLSDHFLRRLILRFIFCRSALALFGPRDDINDEHVPVCLPELPHSLSPSSEAVQSAIIRLADHFKKSCPCDVSLLLIPKGCIGAA